MTEALPIILIVVTAILAIVLIVVGVQLFLVLTEFRQTVRKVNSALDRTEDKLNKIIDPLQNLGGIAAGLKTGSQVFATFMSWLEKRKQKKETDDE